MSRHAESRRPAPIVTAVAAILTLAGCSGQGAPASTDAPTPAASTASTPTVTLPVASAFGAPSWGVQLPASSQQKRPVVTAQRVIYLDGASVKAVDATGKLAWSAQFPAFAGDAQIKDGAAYPFLRLADVETVAVVDGGKAAGSGLSQDRYETRVTLIDVADGHVIKTLVIPGTSSDAPKPSAVGLTVALPDGKGVVAVLADGSTRTLPASTSVGGQPRATDGGATVGSAVISTWESKADGGTPPSSAGFAGPGWTSVSTAPSSAFTSASLIAGDAHRLLVGRWVAPGRTAMDPVTVKILVLDAANGKVVAQPSCEPVGQAVFSSSPDGKHEVIGPMRLDEQGHAQCFGGGAGQKDVALTAVNDSGIAYGTAGAGGSDTSFVTVAPDGKVTTEPLSTGESAPIGIMAGEVAVHWDPNRAVITGNTIK